MTNRTVALLAYDELQPLDLVGPHEVFASANQVLEAQAARRAKTVGAVVDAKATTPAYRITVVAAEAGVVRGHSGLGIATESWEGIGPIDTLVIPGGLEGRPNGSAAPTLAWLREAAPTVRRLACVCTGAFIAADAGLLDGRRVATHWAATGRLAREFPAITVDPDAIYVRDGGVWSSAGVTAGIDL